MTETTAGVIAVPPGTAAPVDATSGSLSVGLPLPRVAPAYRRSGGNPTPPGVAGELEISGPQVVSGYWRNPDASVSTMPGGRLRTGDVAIIDEQGWVYLVDRLKDQINVSGYKVWPREVEDALYEHPGRVRGRRRRSSRRLPGRSGGRLRRASPRRDRHRRRTRRRSPATDSPPTSGRAPCTSSPNSQDPDRKDQTSRTAAMNSATATAIFSTKVTHDELTRTRRRRRQAYAHHVLAQEIPHRQFRGQRPGVVRVERLRGVRAVHRGGDVQPGGSRSRPCCRRSRCSPSVS